MIVRNSARCLGCGDEIESTYRHDFVSCSCGQTSVDGGFSYIRRVGNGNWEDTSLEQVFDTVEQLVEYMTGVHGPDQCVGSICTLHNPTDHHMRSWRVDWEGGMVRICEHDNRHADPDDIYFDHCVTSDCDGCCRA